MVSVQKWKPSKQAQISVVPNQIGAQQKTGGVARGVCLNFVHVATAYRRIVAKQNAEVKAVHSSLSGAVAVPKYR